VQVSDMVKSLVKLGVFLANMLWSADYTTEHHWKQVVESTSDALLVSGSS